MDQFPRRVGAILVLVVSPFAIAFPKNSVFVALFLAPFLPVILYGTIGLFIHRYLWTVPRDAVQEEMEKGISHSLTLAGFSFTSIGLILSFFKDEIKSGNQTAEYRTVFFFCLGLGFFIASYMALRYRTKNLFQYTSEGFTDNGLWCILFGLNAFFKDVNGLRRSRIVIDILLALFLAYLGLHFYHHLVYARKFSATDVSQDKEEDTDRRHE